MVRKDKGGLAGSQLFLRGSTYKQSTKANMVLCALFARTGSQRSHRAWLFYCRTKAKIGAQLITLGQSLRLTEQKRINLILEKRTLCLNPPVRKASIHKQIQI